MLAEIQPVSKNWISQFIFWLVHILYLFWKCVTILLKIWEVKIFIFGDVSGPMAAKWPKENRGLKIVNYFTCVRHFSCRWYGVQEVDLNWYPRICNPYCRDIQIRTCEWTQGKKMTQSKSLIKNSKLFYMYATLLL